MALTLLHQDDFNRADAGLNGATMSDGSGTWADVSGAGSGTAVVSNQAQMGTSSGSPNFLCLVVDSAMPIGTTDQRSEQATHGTDGGPACRVTDKDNCYFAYRGGTFVNIYKVTAGTVSQISGSGVVVVANGDVVGLEAIGTTIRALVNGVEVASATDSDHAAGRCGLYGGGSAAHLLDDFADYVEASSRLRRVACDMRNIADMGGMRG